MPANPDEIKRREAAARAAIKNAFDPTDPESEVALFISYHLEELEPAYWRRHFATETPDPRRILDGLVLQSHWDDDGDSDDDGIETFDFSLPADATNYLICVRFDDAGHVSEVAIES